MFAPENLARSLDQILERDVIVKRLLSDVELDGNLAYERIAQ